MSASREIFIKGLDNKEIFLRIWDYVEQPKAVVQIFHGMAEHSERYDDFAKYLNKQGYIVYSDDHRGHGKSKDKNGFGHVGENGFNNIVEDENLITELIKREYKNIPVYIFAHSFGSFIGQEYITKYSKNIDGIILSGSAKQDGIEIKLAAVLAKIQRKLFNENEEARLIDKLSFGSFNKGIDNQRGKFDWLTRDTNEVDKYIEDENCGFISPINFYYNLFKGLNELYSIDKLNKISKVLPILILSGDRDPVGKYGKSVTRLYEQYRDLGVNNVSIKLYDDARHELLNEINKDEVYDYVGKWITSKIKLNK
ncbi:MAG: alpha/beta hydrolase [Clostridium sp.]|uniref:alpha/beta hydrolase n=1 Tax=Clostridium sp. TaxID=1506 RepID=UPI00303D9624